MTDSPNTIAGEPIEVLARGLTELDFEMQPDGLMSVSGKLDAETAPAWTRALERYGADFIKPGNWDPIEVRHADAFLRFVDEIVEAYAETSQRRPLGDDGR